MPLGLVGGIALASGVLAAGASIYSTVEQGKIASSQRNIQDTIFNEQQYYEQQLQALIANPSSVTKLPGYSFNLQQGAETVARQMGASGFADSGNEAAALTKYGQNYAMNTYDNQVAILSQLAGITAPSSPSQAGAVASNASANQWQQFASLAAGFSTLAGRYSSAGGAGGGGYDSGPGSGMSGTPWYLNPWNSGQMVGPGGSPSGGTGGGGFAGAPS